MFVIPSLVKDNIPREAYEQSFQIGNEKEIGKYGYDYALIRSIHNTAILFFEADNLKCLPLNKEVCYEKKRFIR